VYLKHMDGDKIAQTDSRIKSGESVETGIVHARHDANSSQGQTPKPAGRECLDQGQAQFGHLHARFEEIGESSKPKPICGLKTRAFRQLASAMFGLSRIFGRLGQRFRALSVPVQSISSLESADLNEPGYSLEELVEALVCGREPVPLPKPCSPVAKSFAKDSCSP
jgi:hypothetical protein